MPSQAAGAIDHGLPAQQRGRAGVAIALAGAMLACFGVAEGFGEVAPHFARRIPAAELFAAIADGRYHPGDSIWSKEQFFTDCLDLAQTLLARVQPPSRRDAFATSCREVARATVAQMPAYSTAWLAIADASAELDDLRGLRDGLLNSAQTAPDIDWLASRRSALAHEHLAQLGDVGATAYRADLITMLRSHAGTDALAARYFRDAGQRETITALLETAPATTQRRFLDRVRTLAEPAP